MNDDSRSVPFEVTDYLKTPEDIADYLNAALEDGDEQLLLSALGDAIKATDGMTALARETGLSRESLYRALSEKGNPRLSSLVSILRALGLELSVRARHLAA